MGRPDAAPRGSKKSVLVVGAGPTGLVVAAELLRRGVSVRLVDRAAGPSRTSRAFTVHSRTLEAFDTLGVSDDFLSVCVRATSMNYHFFRGDAKAPLKSFRLPFDGSVLPGRHPCIATVPQTVTESILRAHFERLGGRIEWSTELTAFKELPGADGGAAAGGVEVTLGGQEGLRFDYMVGCDGARSTIRKAQNLAFSGLQYAGMTLKMMDVSLQNTLPTHLYHEAGYHYLIKEKSMLLLAKMGDAKEYGGQKDMWRVLFSTTEPEPDLSLQNFQDGVDRLIDGVQLADPVWTTGYKIHKRMVSSYISEGGRVLLAGDAAHINSPAGGQGMNTAIQDGFNLGWKLALVCQGLSEPAILQTFEAERKPVAAKVLEGTDLLTSVIMAHGKGLQDRIAVASEGRWLEKAVMRISGQAFSYAPPAAAPAGAAGAQAPAEKEEQFGNDIRVGPGDHAPDIVVVRAPTHKAATSAAAAAAAPTRLSQVAAPYYILLVLSDEKLEAEATLQDKYPETLEVVHAAPVDADEPANGHHHSHENGAVDLPSDAVLRAQYGNYCAALIRPDRYVEALVRHPVDLQDAVVKALPTIH